MIRGIPLPCVPFFEGAEKLLEVWFTPSDDIEGLRKISRPKWEKLLDLVNCTIVGYTSNEFYDSYVLSESSMFVSPYRFILKTCGTTTLLRAVPKLLKMAKEECGIDSVEYLFFSRKKFLKPSAQLSPHTSFDEEVRFLDDYFDGSAYSFGKVHSDGSWHLYAVEKKKIDNIRGPDQTLEILMMDLDPEAMRLFYKSPVGPFSSGKEMTDKTGIADLLPGAITEEVAFDPCGYSVNGLLDEAYFTIHITPQPECSYVSFETNIISIDYTELINKVTQIFCPGRFTVTLFSNKERSVCGSSLAGFDEDALEGFWRLDKQFFVFDEYDLSFAQFAGKANTQIS